MSANIFVYIIDMNERGEFRAHVEDVETGETVFEFSSDEETGEVWMVEDGFMRNVEDMRGLESYLKEMKVIPKDATLYDDEDEAEDALDDYHETEEDFDNE